MKNYKAVLLITLITFLFSGFIKSPKGDVMLTLKSSEVKFKGTTAITDVEAVSKSMVGVINLTTDKFAFIIKMNTFDFDNKSMQDHYNEKYLETEKYKNGKFSGTLNKVLDINKNGSFNTTIKGKLDVHGVVKDKTIPVSIKVENKKVTITSTFNVNLKEHNIEIPSLVFAKVGEDIKVDMVANLE